MSDTQTVLDMIAMNGEDGVTTKELLIASGKRVTQRTRETLLDQLNTLVSQGRLVSEMGWRKDIAGRPYKVPVFRPVK